MKKLMILISVFILFSFSLALAVSIEYCKSDGTYWECEKNGICICRLSEDCDTGDLLVYETDIRTLLCAPRISDRYAYIDWSDCDYPVGKVKVMAICNMAQSEEKEITIYDSGGDGGSGGGSWGTTTSTTTSTTIIPCKYVCQAVCTDDNNPPFCYRRISHGTSGCTGGTICCESILKTCPKSSSGTTLQKDKTCPYECCIDMPGYEYKYCPSGLSCCDHLCKESCESSSSGFNISKSLIFWILLASILPIIAFLIFIWKKNADSNIPEY